MFGTAAPFLGQGGIDPRMVSGPANAYMQQMSSLPIQALGGGMGGGAMMGGMPGGYGGGFQGGQGPQMDAIRAALQGYGGTGNQIGRMAGRIMPSGGIESGGMVNGQWQPNGGDQGSYGYGYGVQGGKSGQPGGPRLGGDPTWHQPQPMPGPPLMAPPQQPQPFQPQGPGQRVTAEQLAARGLNPQEIQRRLQQFAGGQLGWQRGQRDGGGQAGRPNVDPRTGQPVDPTAYTDSRFPRGFEGPNNGMPGGQPDMNDPRVRDFIERMSGNPAAGGGAGQPQRNPTRGGVQRMPQPRGPQRPPMVTDPTSDMVSRPINPPTDMIARRIPPQQQPRPQGFRPGGGNRDNRQQTDVTNIRY